MGKGCLCKGGVAEVPCVRDLDLVLPVLLTWPLSVGQVLPVCLWGSVFSSVLWGEEEEGVIMKATQRDFFL